jgi:L-ascorbate metabolism protein UlaG (beta-lactamase superfamily)
MFAAALLPTGCRVFGGLSSTVAQNFVAPRPAGSALHDPVRSGVRLSALWVGHSTVLLQMDDRVIMTDPFLTDHAAELKIRLVAPGIDLADLSRCDIILVSHSHADHCNLGSLAMLERRFPDAALVFPDGVEEFLPRFSYSYHRMRRGDEQTERWIGDSTVIDGVQITTVVSAHWGGRYGIDGTLWGYAGYTGYIVQYHGLTVYFPGDTGYNRALSEELGRRYRIDLVLLPIGPTSDPDSLGQPYHVYAKGALAILRDTRAKVMIPIHYGTTHEPFDRYNPEEVLRNLLSDEPELAARVRILAVGEQVILRE